MAIGAATAASVTLASRGAVAETSPAIAAESQFLEIDGRTIAYRRFGRGRPLLLLQRFRGGMGDWDPAFLEAFATGKTTPETMMAQVTAGRAFFGNVNGRYERLPEITAPVLVANGDRDASFPIIDSVILAREIPDAQLVVYPDAGHAFHFQYAERFAEDALHFLNH